MRRRELDTRLVDRDHNLINELRRVFAKSVCTDINTVVQTP